MSETERKDTMVSEAYMQREVKRALARGEKRARTALMADESFLAEVRERHGLVPKSEATKQDKQTAEQFRADLRKEFEEKELAPLRKQLEEATATVDTLRGSEFDSKLLQAAAEVGLKASLLKPAAGGKPVALSMFRGEFGFDGESKDWYQKRGDTFAPSLSSKNAYKTVSEFMQEWAKDPGNAEFLDSKAQPGSGLQPSQPAATGGTYTSAQISGNADLITQLAQGKISVAA